MARVWHSPQAMKRLAMALLALALVGIAASLAANRKAIAIQGPGAMRAVDDRSLWLGVDEELWVLDADGQRTAQRTVAQLGLTAAISNIVPAHDGQVLLTSREDATWQLVDRATLKHVRSVHPRWPDDIGERHALHFAVSPDGDIAVATGGGHTVLLFDRDGLLKARTASGTYRFTNGLWWSREGWWTTDTNRFALHLLDERTLQVVRTVELAAAPPGHPFLAEAQPSQGRPWPGSGAAPLATLTRVGERMEPGHAADVFADGRQLLFNKAPLAQLRDLTWFAGHLLLVDGATYTIHRFAPDRIEEAAFGDDAVRATFARMRADRDFWERLGSRYAFGLAALLLLAGIGAHARQQQLAALAVVAQREGGVAPATPLRELSRQRFCIYGVPVAVRLIVLAISLFVLFPLLYVALIETRPVTPAQLARLLLFTALLPDTAAALWQQWRHARLSQLPEYEAALNHRAIEWLRAHDDFDRVKLEGETARETVYLPGWRPRWLLVTNRRVLLFAASARERRLQSEWPRRAVLFAGPPAEVPGAAHGFWSRLLVLPPNLALTFTTGTTLRLRCASGATAARVAGLLLSSPAVLEEGVTVEVPALPPPRRWREVLASLLVPGTGQWLQGRFASGAVMFTAALLLCVFDWGPVVWALHGPKMDVSLLPIVSAALTWLLLALLAGSDAWHFSGARPRR